MNELNIVLNDQRRVDADKQTSGVAQPGNRNEPNQKYRLKACFGCGDNFLRSQQNNYDYCLNCTINGHRYIPRKYSKSRCPECGNGSGIIKFPNLPPRACKLCYLSQEAKIMQKEPNHV